MFNNLKVGTRLMFGFGLMIALLIVIIGIDLRHSWISEQNLDRIVIVNNERLKLTNHIVDEARNTAISVRNLLIAGYSGAGAGRSREVVAGLAAERTRYAGYFSELEKIMPPDDTKGLLLFDKVRSAEKVASRLQDQVVALAVAGKTGEATAFMNGKAYPAVSEWIREADNFIHHNEARNLMRFNQVQQTSRAARLSMLWAGSAALVISIFAVVMLSLSVTNPLKSVVKAADRVASGNLEEELVPLSGRSDEFGTLQRAFGDMVAKLRENRAAEQRDNWLKSGLARLSLALLGDPAPSELAGKVVAEISAYLGAQAGAVYLALEGNAPGFSLAGSCAYGKSEALPKVFRPGEGLVGQAAAERRIIIVRDVPKDYYRVTSGLGERVPGFLYVCPLVNEGRVKGVLELGTFAELAGQQLEYLDRALPGVALAVESAEARFKLARSLEESQAQGEELQAQQEELRAANETLADQTQALKASEEELKTQQEELQVTNEELEEKNNLLDRQNRDVEAARRDIEEKAADLALASKYKSEFLANMSHELRTPLNSLLLLAQVLVQNKEGNLTPEQVEAARIIYGGGSDLLSLINEILDLSKIEAGRMEVRRENIRVADLADGARVAFSHVAADKGLKLEVEISADAPAELVSDRKRLDQILRNLLSNALKFTEAGSVSLLFTRPAAGEGLVKAGLPPEQCLAVAVRDTGIGIAPASQQRVFEAFQQADGSTARKYGGTGLGLSISTELARLLGGEIKLKSEPGKGSVFTLYLPVVPTAAAGHKAVASSATALPDDREDLAGSARVILVVEDDQNFAKLLYTKCRGRGFKCLLAGSGEAGLELARKYLPAAVLLDVGLPGMNGWAVLDALKNNVETRHIPVHIISAGESPAEALRRGAVGYAAKPVTAEDVEAAFARLERAWSGNARRLLLVENSPEMRARTKELISGADVKVDAVGTGAEALAALRAGGYDCVVLDLGLPDIDGMDLLKKLEGEGAALPPVIIHTARDLTREEEAAFRERAESIIIKDVRSQERLLDEVSLFLHRVVGEMPEKKGRIIRDLHDAEQLLKGRKVLIVDDDMRTAFAMSRLLAQRGMKPLKAEDGEKALRLLEKNPDTDLVLMDIMMPVMDGYEAMRRIRAQEKFRKLPIIVLTAKAMPEDRAKCLAAGANDYIPKPVDPERLFSLMQIWLCR